MIYLLLFLLCLETQASEIQHTHAEQKKHLHGTHRECPLPKILRISLIALWSFTLAYKRVGMKFKAPKA